MVTRIADPHLPFGGTWTYEIAPTETGSTLTITEKGEVYNPVFRFVSRYLQGYTATHRQLYARLTPPLTRDLLKNNSQASKSAVQRFQPEAAARNQSCLETGEQVNMLIILLVILLLLSVGSFPAWPYSRGWGYYPSSGLGLVLVILVILLLLGRI